MAREQPTLLPLLTCALVLVLAAIWIWIRPLAAIRNYPKTSNPITGRFCLRRYAAPGPFVRAPRRASTLIGSCADQAALRAEPGRICPM
jgi:hypothetical protein